MAKSMGGRDIIQAELLSLLLRKVKFDSGLLSSIEFLLTDPGFPNFSQTTGQFP